MVLSILKNITWGVWGAGVEFPWDGGRKFFRFHLCLLSSGSGATGNGNEGGDGESLLESSLSEPESDSESSLDELSRASSDDMIGDFITLYVQRTSLWIFGLITHLDKGWHYIIYLSNLLVTTVLDFWATDWLLDFDLLWKKMRKKNKKSISICTFLWGNFLVERISRGKQEMRTEPNISVLHA